MEIKDYLDRFEILYEGHNCLADYRRAYNDKDLSSIFRVISNEDLRKSVMEDNIHSIFRILEDLKIEEVTIDFQNFKKSAKRIVQ